MAREIKLYAVSVAEWKESIHLAGVVLAPGKGVEEASSSAIVKQLTRDQTPEACPDAPRFLHALGQTCICIRSPEELKHIDGVAFADTEAKHAVASFLGVGRSLSGADLDRHAIYGFLTHGAELDALLALVRSKAWGAYTTPFRFRAKAIPEFEAQRATVAEWLEGLRASGRDVYFASEAFWLPKTKVARAAATGEAAAPRKAAPTRSAAKTTAKVSSTKATPKPSTRVKSVSKKPASAKRPAAKAK